MKNRWLKGALVVVAILLFGIQLVPYGRAHANPKVLAEPQWDSVQTHQLFAQACNDCHSNETNWPWYSNVAPISWLVQDHVDEGRLKFNVSEWGRPENEGDASAELVQEGEMPIPNYTWLHPQAQLSPSDKEVLIKGLKLTFGEASESQTEDETD